MSISKFAFLFMVSMYLTMFTLFVFQLEVTNLLVGILLAIFLWVLYWMQSGFTKFVKNAYKEEFENLHKEIDELKKQLKS
ncbi:MAG: hypothetical protein IBX55_17830 [Methyloprofundus sp.]|nr:hypothetical protein [Methyloprofundus sp.]